MNKMHGFTLALVLAVLASVLFTPWVSARPREITYVVNSNAGDADANPGDQICATAGGVCTLNAAIQESNADGDASTIHFSQKFQSTNHISGCGLEGITADNTVIDASNQWDSTYDRPGVELIGMSCTLLAVGGNNNTVLGLLFGGSDQVGVRITGSLTIIGGYNSGQRNVFISGVTGVYVLGGTSNGIFNNYFGTIDGTTLTAGGTNSVGILVQGGDYTTIENNVIAGQSSYGIELLTSNSFVQDNVIGMSWNRSTALPNQIGVEVAADGNTIGPNNTIAGNTGNGIDLFLAGDNDIQGNYVGYNNIGNGGNGINLHNSDNNRITQSNLIAYNTGHGISADASDGLTIQSNTIDSNTQAGINFEGCTTSRIGGPGIQRNTIINNQSHGIHLDASSAITVTSNYIGLNQGAFDGGNQGFGILVDNGSTGNNIGIAGPDLANWIGWNHLDGVELEGSATHHNYVVGNVIGAPINWGWEAPNYHHGIGIYGGAHDNWVGWDGLPGGGNIILSSGWSGIAIVSSPNNAVLVNRIGTNGLDIHWGNAFYGVTVSGAGNSIKENEIAYNGTNGGLDNAQAGVWVDGAGSTDNMITGNSIHDNDGPGIQLTNGANHDLAAPVITSASCSQVQGTACANCLVEIYSDYADEGQRYEGSLITPAGGAFTWNGAPYGPNVTALVIGPGSARDTSPFSAAIHVGICKPFQFFLPLLRK